MTDNPIGGHMGAHVSHEFKGKFVLGEEELRKIHEVIRKRLPDGIELRVDVRRSDSFAYSTEQIGDVCGEENGPSATVLAVTYQVESDSLKVRLIFSSKSGSRLDIVGDDRDVVFLLSNDLKAYVEQEVMKLKWLPASSSSRSITLVLMLLLMLGMLASMAASYPRGVDVDALTNGVDIHAKLNYLVESRSRVAEGLMIWPFAILIMLMIGLTFDLHAKIIRALFPGNDFFIGKKKSLVEERSKLRANLFWSVVVAGGLGILISAYFARGLA